MWNIPGTKKCHVFSIWYVAKKVENYLQSGFGRNSQCPPGGVGLKKIIQEGCTIDVERDSRLFKKLSFLAVLNFSLLIDTMC